MNGLKRAIVVGGGIAGLTTAWSLAKDGVAVDLYEQGPLPNPIASSYDEHRIIRHAYGKLEGYARLMPAAYKAWDALWEDLGVRHFLDTGATYFLRGDDGWLDATIRSLDETGVVYRDLPLGEIEACYPMVEPDGVQRVLETEGAGMLFPIRIVTDLVVRLQRLGVTLHAYSKVTAVDPDAGTITVDGKRIAADQVAVCAGAWIDRLVPRLKGLAVPSRQAVVYLAPPPSLAAAWAEAPVIVTRGTEGGLYILPARGGTRLKFGDHRFSRDGNADDDRRPTAADMARLRPLLGRSFRLAEQYVRLEEKACFYTVTTDESFWVGAIGARGWAMSACSGHGFKFGPLMGRGLADAMLGRTDPDTLHRWAAARG
jgi:glycine/D-amino acid oxidase-like deaminating enzyme